MFLLIWQFTAKENSKSYLIRELIYEQLYMNNGKQSHSISFSTPDTGYQKLFEFFFITNLQNSLICHAFNTDLVLSLFLPFSENMPVSLNDLKIFRQKFKAMFLCSVKKPFFLVLKRTMSFSLQVAISNVLKC